MLVFIRCKTLEMMLNEELVDKLPSVTKIHGQIPGRGNSGGKERAP